MARKRTTLWYVRPMNDYTDKYVLQADERATDEKAQKLVDRKTGQTINAWSVSQNSFVDFLVKSLTTAELDFKTYYWQGHRQGGKSLVDEWKFPKSSRYASAEKVIKLVEEAERKLNQLKLSKVA